MDFNLTIKNEGDIICLLGPSGIGKTTILRSIAGLQKIVKGKIILKGVTLSSEKRHIEPERRNIALSFQDNSCFLTLPFWKTLTLAQNETEKQIMK